MQSGKQRRVARVNPPNGKAPMRISSKTKKVIKTAATHYYDIHYYAKAMAQEFNHEVALDIVSERFELADDERELLNEYLYGFVTL